MYKPYLIIICGIPATGKTALASRISNELQIPLLCKDYIKECLYDNLHYDTSNKAEALKYALASYRLFYRSLETLMKVKMPAVIESNFDNSSKLQLLELIKKYNYNTLSIKLDGDLKAIHKRFANRDTTNERHPGLRASHYVDFESFARRCREIQKFSIGDTEIKIDTTDFSHVNYDNIYNSIQMFLSDL